MNRIILGDCMEGMKRTPDKYYDLACVDPPYGIDFADWDKKDMKPTTEYFEQLFRISEKQIIWGGNYFVLPHSIAWICWDKSFSDYVNKTPYHKNKIYSEFELAWTSLNIRATFVRLTDIGNITGFNGKLKVDYKKKKDIHPTQKPLQLYDWIFKNYAEPGMKVLDSHGGSLSSVISAIRAGLTIDCYEIDKDYYLAGKKRVTDYFSQLNAFESQPQIEWI